MIKILQITDFHILAEPSDRFLGVDTEIYLKKIIAHAFQQHHAFDLILITGDLTQFPGKNSYQRIYDILYKTATPCLYLPGNHDDWQLMQSIFSTQNMSCAKHTTLGNWRIICLNSQIVGSPKGYLAETELQALSKRLQQDEKHPVLIALHHNFINTGSEWLDTMTIGNSQQFIDLIAAHPQVKIITTGHIHQEYQGKISNALVYGSPATCFQFKPKSKDFALDPLPPGYRVFELHENGQSQSAIYRLEEVPEGLDLTICGY